MRHQWTASIVLAGALLVGGACSSDREPTAPAPTVTPAPNFSLSGQQSVDEQIHRLIPQLFPGTVLRVAVFVAHESIEFLLKRGKTSAAQKQTLDLVAFTLQKYSRHQLIGDQSQATQDKLRSFVDLLFQFVGLGSAQIPPDALGPDGAVAIVGPAGGRVVTETQLAGADFPTGALSQNVVVTINRASNQTNPLPTVLQQFPLFYEFKTFPDVPQFGQQVTVGICVLDAAVQEAEVDPANLRLAHPLHSDPSAIEILPRVTQNLVDPDLCAAAFGARKSQASDLASAGRTVARDLFWLMMGAPRDLSATASKRRMMPGGLGGGTKAFSTFGAVNFTGEFVPYKEIGYRFLKLGAGQPPPSGFQQPNFVTSGWFTSQAAFGSGGCELDGTIHTDWPAASDTVVTNPAAFTEILLRKRFSGSAQNVQVLVPVDNDVQVFVNGQDITEFGGTVDGEGFHLGTVDGTGFLRHEECADPAHPFVFPVENSLLLAGGNLVVVRARDRGVISYVDVKVTGELPEE